MAQHFFRSTFLALCLCDCAAVLFSCTIAVLLRAAFGGIVFSLYAGALSFLLIFPLLYLTLGLYPGLFLRNPEELKRLTIATSTGFMLLALVFFLAKAGASYSRAVLLLAWFFCLFSVPFARCVLRRRCGRAPWWGYPCVLFGRGKHITALCRAFSGAANQGLRATVLVLPHGDPVPECADFTDRLRIVRADPADSADRETLSSLAAAIPGVYAVLSLAGFSDSERLRWMQCIDIRFQRVVVVPEMPLGGRIWAMAATIGDMPGLLLRQNLLDARRMASKRFLDLAITLLGGILLFPLLCGLAYRIRRDSPGPALFRQERIGRNGRRFMVYKFRTMVLDAEERLAAHLAANPDARAEWEATQKLKDDPRITGVGAFLRRTSLDELPQIINVLRGEMSLVGPRPIVEDEIARYGEYFTLYGRVRPGITGLWQVCGRNNLPYPDRVSLDRHYICNWSLWMDLSIIIRTIPEVLRCSGAY